MEEITSVNAGMILKTLDGQLVNKYIFKLEEAKKILAEYLVNIEDVSKRLNKVDSSTMRKALGEGDLFAKKEALESTLSKLNAHQKASLERLTSK